MFNYEVHIMKSAITLIALSALNFNVSAIERIEIRTSAALTTASLSAEVARQVEQSRQNLNKQLVSEANNISFVSAQKHNAPIAQLTLTESRNANAE